LEQVDTQVGVQEMEPLSTPMVIGKKDVSFKEDSSPTGLRSTQVESDMREKCFATKAGCSHLQF
jgi:hypothetical protein